MLLGYNTNGFAHHTLEDAIAILAELGYQSIAITLDHHALNPFDPDCPAQCERIRVLLEKHRLRSVIETGALPARSSRKHQPTLLSEFADRARVALRFLAAGDRHFATARRDAVSFWSGTPDSDADCWNRLIDGCRRLCDEAGMNGVRLAFEPEPGMFIDTMEKFAELHRRVDHPHFGLTLDVGHLHCLGETPIAGHIERLAGLALERTH